MLTIWISGQTEFEASSDGNEWAPGRPAELDMSKIASLTEYLCKELHVKCDGILKYLERSPSLNKATIVFSIS